MIEAISPISSFDVNVEQGMCSITEDELSERNSGGLDYGLFRSPIIGQHK